MTSTAARCRRSAAKACWTKIKKSLPRARGRGLVDIDAGRSLGAWVQLCRCRAVGLVDRYLRQPAQQFGAAVSRGVGGQQLGSLVNEGG